MTILISKEKLMGFKSLEELWVLTSESFSDRILSYEEIHYILFLCRGIWHYQNPEKPTADFPHARIGDICFDGYAQIDKALAYNRLRHIFTDQLYRMLRNDHRSLHIDRVITSNSATSIMHAGQDICRMIGKGCQLGTTKIDETGAAVWDGKMTKAAYVLQLGRQIFDLTEDRKALRAVNPDQSFAPVSLVMTHMGPMTSLEGVPFITLLHMPNVRTYPSSECPYCKVGSPTHDPRFSQGWFNLKG